MTNEENPFRNIVPVQKFDANKASKDELIQFIEKQNNQLKNMSSQICVLLHMNERSQGEWISVKERLPEEGESVLVCLQTQGGMAQFVSERFNDNCWSALGGCTPLAWQPLPKPYEGG